MGTSSSQLRRLSLKTMGQGAPSVRALLPASEDASVFMLRNELPLSDIGCRRVLGGSNWTLGVSVTHRVQFAVPDTTVWWR